jgi:hypothetical protein
MGKRCRVATFPHIVVPPHSLLSTAVCSGCQPRHLSSIFPCRLPPSRECPSAANAGRLPRPCLRRVAGECRRHRMLSCRCSCQSVPLPIVQCASAGRAALSRAFAVATHAPRKRRPRALPAAWAACTLGPPRTLGRVRCADHHTGTMAVDCALLYHYAVSGFGTLAFDLFLYFLIIFKFLQIQKFV